MLLGSVPQLDRVAIHLGPFPVYWYGIIIGTGVLLGLWLATREGERLGIPKDTFVDLVLFAVPIAIICARAYYVAFEWEYYMQNPIQIINTRQGGLAIHGGLIGAVMTGIIYAKVKRISFWKLADIAAPSILLGQAIGRWGNFMNQEAHGGEVTRQFLEGLHLPDFIVNQMYIDGVYYHPTFLYESLWSFAGVILLLLLRKANLRRGELFFTYLIWYSIGRFFVEELRTDSLMLGPLRIAQVMSIGLIVISIIFIIVRRKTGQADKRYLEK
ncbi:prolipoprotein diacylglyceryl transferase [Bacillus cytotoxicus]|uniref:Phosphatidylglycerol--prolipoprotein diacylglyceryl transferase n=2 Tax=Bacillus cytotoxicus TaxID=580165 RepID=LGT_BACCN|nr:MULTISPECIES: prolipoprotein diacylglyceryl transferase [Bacillus cereus group]A7GUU4.1 RecName: Full=Phosphatidylglycerol--prolipoprotein diacylglyceryl transferase [Bacillus cytotoxicus NVH 391-98]ABS23902.1 prolipoprotein diacylglyceryl transferase [Bacillus cytotoxicus NVH 391-98]AWC34527.1 prolipoprotein diacylglyceryl transferase [Bacillus cytotoxicus]AWC38524.1 prolipoprotein diacylglyceryl transferase [Bacillus cytotoxicus]AWC46502.1 prolipoprotein diacylglyceryl transferase [Bacill